MSYRAGNKLQLHVVTDRLKLLKKRLLVVWSMVRILQKKNTICEEDTRLAI